MKSITKTLLTMTLALSLPLGAYAATAVEVADTSTPEMNCPMGGSGKMMGKQHKQGKQGRHHQGRMQQFSPEQMEANLQQRYDAIEDPAQKTEFIKQLQSRTERMSKHTEAMTQFINANH